MSAERLPLGAHVAERLAALFLILFGEETPAYAPPGPLTARNPQAC